MKVFYLFGLISIFIFCCDNNKSIQEKSKKEVIKNIQYSNSDSALNIKKENIYCNCFKSFFSKEKQKPLYSFSFTNGQTIIICGYSDNLKEKFKNGYTVFDCMSKSEIEMISENNATKWFFKNDTFRIIHFDGFYNLKTKNYDMQEYKQKLIYFDKMDFKSKVEYTYLPCKLSLNEINDILNEYKNFINGYLSEKESYENIQVLLYKLFYSSLSNNKMASQYFNNFEKEIMKGKFKDYYGGEIAETYIVLKEIIIHAPLR